MPGLVNVIDEAHVAGVAVLISVGGWGWDAEFEALAADPATATCGHRQSENVCRGNDLDGADIVGIS